MAQEADDKGPMSGGGDFKFFVVNIGSSNLTGTVKWTGGGRSASINVSGLAPGSKSDMTDFAPQGGVNDYWNYSAKGSTTYKLNVYDNDNLTVVVISNYGIGVLVTSTSPGTWAW